MEDLKTFIESGILESYAIGMANDEEKRKVESMSVLYPQVKAELEEIRKAMELYAVANSSKPHATLKPMILASIDYSERIENGESPSYPPIIYTHSKIEDYSEWLNREDMVVPEDFTDIYVKLIGVTPGVTSAIVWIKEIAPLEVHDNEYEKFLIVEGTCDIFIGEDVHHLAAGDSLSIPLYVHHHVIVTSEIPCKVILQRLAA